MGEKIELLYIAEKCSQMDITDLGKKKFQKLVYLIEKVGNTPLGYDYEIYFYGPYSRKLDDDLDELSREDLIRYTRRGQSHLIGITGEARGELEAGRLSAEWRGFVDESLERFGGKTPYELELLTTTHYVASLLGPAADRKNIERGVKKIKGEKFSASKIETAVSELKLA
ncbi:hypothetical protein C1878_07430 [Gordonibacter sp. 28C]|uniref:hypothetical protein n=1 Tax=Gordonibacter sp. 28C TaxID=2078569 RepID=UPI000DF77048|nr:hypothetical protein [Gordonibacter sp. 28C]RDB62846.1 hypothetical protein C1878_07430 [Gordonibacter sp. 28C]